MESVKMSYKNGDSFKMAYKNSWESIIVEKWELKGVKRKKEMKRI